MWFFKTKKGRPVKAVIHDDCYSKLPDTLKSRLYPAPDDAEVTHTVGSVRDWSGEEFFLCELGSSGLDMILGSSGTPTENYSIEDSPAATPDTDFDFGGGSGGGAGATDSY
jgi:hypothetical protein